METEEGFVWVSFENKSRTHKVRRVDVEHAAAETLASQSDEDHEWCEQLLLQQDLWEEHGSVLALLDTLEICNEQQLVLPVWASEALREMLVRRARGEKQEATRAGRTSTRSRDHFNSMLQYVRKDTVTRIRHYQALEPCLFSFLILPVGLKRIYAGEPCPDLGTTIEQAVKHAHSALAGTKAQASEETLRKAYFSKDEVKSSPWDLASLEALEAVWTCPGKVESTN